MNYEIRIDRKALNFINRLPHAQKRRIFAAINRLPEESERRQLGAVPDVYWSPAGDYRILYSVELVEPSDDADTFTSAAL